ncbi:MAG: preprotein translocase subunit YajC [Clostridia bacterium]|nr:preprotein translocase subunit YajC [Clostridia bacterium]
MILIMYAIIFIVFYFILIRPQKKRQKQLANMIDALQINDEVVTAGGIKGKIASIKEDTVVIETGADKVKIVFEKSAISKVLTIHE